MPNYLAHDPLAVPTNDITFPITAATESVLLPPPENNNRTLFLTFEGLKTNQTAVIFDEVPFK